MNDSQGAIASQSILLTLMPLVLLLTFGVAAAIFSRALRLNPIVGYILLGILLSASGLGTVVDSGLVEVFAELGVVFLLFDIGLHFSFQRVCEQATDIFGFGLVQVALGTIGLGPLALAFGIRFGPALLVGATLALSSTAVVARLIAEQRQQNCPVGRTGIAILMFQDVAAIFILIVATALGTGEAILPAIALALVKATAALAAAAAAARVAIRPLFDLIARTRNEEAFAATALLVALATAWATNRIGLSLTLGAFLGGMVLAETPYRATVQSEVKPFRGLLLGFFFISVGLAMDRQTLLHAWPAVLAVGALLVAAKGLLNAFASLMFRWSAPGSLQLGFLLAQGSEFAFLIFRLTGVRARVGERPSAVLIAAVALSLAATPSTAELGRSLAGRIRRGRARAAIAADPELTPHAMPGPVLIAGMGRRGRVVADALMEFGVGYAAVERDERRMREAIADGYAVIFGDVGDPRLWEAVSMGDRRISVITAPSLEASTGLNPMARIFFPGLKRIVAVTDAETGAGFAALGLLPVVDDGPLPGVALAAATLAELGVAADRIAVWAERQRERA